MSIRFIPTEVTSTYAAIAALSDNFSEIANLMDLCLLRDGTGDNAMLAPLDMSHYPIHNVGDAVTNTDAVNLGQVSTILSSVTKGEKGDVGGNVLSIGTFSVASALTVPVGTKLVQVSGTTTAGDTGAGRQFVEAAEVNTGFVTANPLISFIDAAGRGFREIDVRTGEKLVPFLLVIAGQSNAAGANGGGSDPASPLVQTWDGTTSSWGSSDYTQLPWTRSNPDGNLGRNNYALAAAHRIAEESRRPVYIVFDAVGGTSIDQWVASGTASTRYAALKTKIQAALATAQLAEVTKVDAIIWAQGEEDAAVSFATHLTSLGLLNTQLRAETWMGQYTPVFVPGMSDLHDRFEVSAALRHFTKVTPGWRYVSNEGQPTSDATHFTGPALWDMGYNIIGGMILTKENRSPVLPFNPFYNRGNGRLTQADADAIATFDNLVNWSSRTSGPGVTDNFTGDGATTSFTLTVRNSSPATVTVGGVTKTTPTDYTVATTGTGLPVITFVAPPAAAAAIVVGYAQAVNGPASVGSISFGYRCQADGNYTHAGGYLTYTSGACNYTLLHGRELTASDSADYSAGFGFQNALTNTYQFAAGRGHTLAASGEAAFGTFSKYQDGSRKFQVGIGASSGGARNAIGVNAAQGNVELYAPASAADPGNTSELTFALTSNTTLVVKVKGTDGTVRSATLTLA